MYLGFLALAAGSILYVIVALLNVGARMARRETLMYGLLVGLFLGLATDFVVVGAGG